MDFHIQSVQTNFNPLNTTLLNPPFGFPTPTPFSFSSSSSSSSLSLSKLMGCRCSIFFITKSKKIEEEEDSSAGQEESRKAKKLDDKKEERVSKEDVKAENKEDDPGVENESGEQRESYEETMISDEKTLDFERSPSFRIYCVENLNGDEQGGDDNQSKEDSTRTSHSRESKKEPKRSAYTRWTGLRAKIICEKESPEKAKKGKRRTTKRLRQIENNLFY